MVCGAANKTIVIFQVQVAEDGLTEYVAEYTVQEADKEVHDGSISCQVVYTDMAGNTGSYRMQESGICGMEIGTNITTRGCVCGCGCVCVCACSLWFSFGLVWFGLVWFGL